MATRMRIANARRHGYGMSDPSAPTATGEKAPSAADVDPRLRTALLGPNSDLARLVIDGHTTYMFPRTGCAAQAHITIYGSLDAWARISYIPQEVNLTLGAQARSDHRYAAALRHWRTCMAAHQYRYTSPTDIINDLATKYTSDREPLARRRAKEIKLATQDVTCNQQASLSSTENTLRRDYAQLLNPAERAELTRLANLFAQARLRGSAIG